MKILKSFYLQGRVDENNLNLGIPITGKHIGILGKPVKNYIIFLLFEYSNN